MSHERGAVRDARVDPTISGELRRGITSGGESVERFIEVTRLERAVAGRTPREHPGEAIGGGFVVVRHGRIGAELRGDRMSHLVGDDADGRHVAIGTEVTCGGPRLTREEDLVEEDRVARRAVRRVVPAHHAAGRANRTPIAHEAGR